MKRGVFLSVASATASDNSRAVLVDEAPSVKSLCRLQSCGERVCSIGV